MDKMIVTKYDVGASKERVGKHWIALLFIGLINAVGDRVRVSSQGIFNRACFKDEFFLSMSERRGRVPQRVWNRHSAFIECQRKFIEDNARHVDESKRSDFNAAIVLSIFTGGVLFTFTWVMMLYG